MEIVLLWILCFISYLWHLVKWLGTIENKASKLAVLHVLKTSSGVLGGRVNVLQVCVLAGTQISYIFIYIFILTHNGVQSNKCQCQHCRQPTILPHSQLADICMYVLIIFPDHCVLNFLILWSVRMPNSVTMILFLNNEHSTNLLKNFDFFFFFHRWTDHALKSVILVQVEVTSSSSHDCGLYLICLESAK